MIFPIPDRKWVAVEENFLYFCIPSSVESQEHDCPAPPFPPAWPLLRRVWCDMYAEGEGRVRCA